MLLKPTHEALGRFVVPVYRNTDHGVAAVGSGLLLFTGRRHLFLTAAHVLDHYTASPLLIWSGPTARFIALEGEALLTKSPPAGRNADPVDVAVVTLCSTIVANVMQSDSAFAGVEIVSLDRPADGIYAFAGYPVADNEPFASAQTGVRAVTLVQRTLHIFYLAEADAKGYRRVHRARRHHFVGTLDPPKAVPMGREMATPPDPVGLSGGGLFYLAVSRDRSSRQPTLLLAGIGIEYVRKKRLIVATSMSLVAPALMQALSRPLPSS